MKVQKICFLLGLLVFSGLHAMEPPPGSSSSSAIPLYVEGEHSEELRALGIFHLIIPHQRQTIGREPGGAHSLGVLFSAGDVDKLPPLEQYLINSGCGFLASYAAIKACNLLHQNEHISHGEIVRALNSKNDLLTFFWDSYKKLYGSTFGLPESFVGSAEVLAPLDREVVAARNAFEEHLRDVVAIDYPINVGAAQILDMLGERKEKEGLAFLGQECDVVVCSDDQTKFTFLSDTTKFFNVDFDKTSQDIKAYCADIALGLKKGLILIAPNKAHVYDRSEGWHYLCLVIRKGAAGRLEMLVMEGMNESHYADFGSGGHSSMVEWVYKNHIESVNKRCVVDYKSATDSEMVKYVLIASTDIERRLQAVFSPIMSDLNPVEMRRLNSIFALFGLVERDEYAIADVIFNCIGFVRDHGFSMKLSGDFNAVLLYVALYSMEIETTLPFCPACRALENPENPLLVMPCGKKDSGVFVKHLACRRCLKGALGNIIFSPFNGRAHVKCFACSYLYDAKFVEECEHPDFVRANNIFSEKMADSGSESEDVLNYVSRMRGWRAESFINPYEEAEMCAVGHVEGALKTITNKVRTGGVFAPIEDLYLEFFTRTTFFNAVELCQLSPEQPEQHFEVGQIVAIIRKEARETQPELAAMGERLVHVLSMGANPAENIVLRKHVTLLLWQGIGWVRLNRLIDALQGATFVNKLAILNSVLYNADYGLGSIRSDEDFAVIKRRTERLRNAIDALLLRAPEGLSGLPAADFEQRVKEAIVAE